MPRISGKVRKERVAFSQDEISGFYDTFSSIIDVSPSEKVKINELSLILKRYEKKLLDYLNLAKIFYSAKFKHNKGDI